MYCEIKTTSKRFFCNFILNDFIPYSYPTENYNRIELERNFGRIVFLITNTFVLLYLWQMEHEKVDQGFFETYPLVAFR
jgi:hypothetical protein